ncbi:MAG: hypothetical protein ACRDTV_05765 [Mycobacterium sp.]
MAVVALCGLYLRSGKQDVRYLYATYAAAAVMFAALAGLLALLGSTGWALVAVLLVAVGLPVALIRDKRRLGRKERKNSC